MLICKAKLVKGHAVRGGGCTENYYNDENLAKAIKKSAFLFLLTHSTSDHYLTASAKI